MQYRYFVGIDPSKAEFHYHILDEQGQCRGSGLVQNQVRAIDDFVRQLPGQLGVEGGQILYCVEHTGLYVNRLLSVAAAQDLALWLEDPLQLSQSMGRRKGKTDPLDASRIADYALSKKHKVRLWQPEQQTVLHIKRLMRNRKRLVKYKQALKVAAAEEQTFSLLPPDAQLQASVQAAIDRLQQSIKEIDAQLLAAIKQDPATARLYQIARSVPGLGPKNTIVIMVLTGLFEKVSTAKACASYAGVAPFPHQSGTSVRRRQRTSRQANRELKTAFHQGAFSLISRVPYFQAFYEKKKAQGKSHLQAINAVRNKIIRILYACIQNDVMYEKNYQVCLQVS